MATEKRCSAREVRTIAKARTSIAVNNFAMEWQVKAKQRQGMARQRTQWMSSAVDTKATAKHGLAMQRKSTDKPRLAMELHSSDGRGNGVDRRRLAAELRSSDVISNGNALYARPRVAKATKNRFGCCNTRNGEEWKIFYTHSTSPS